MLDLLALSTQLATMGDDLGRRRGEARARLGAALGLLSDAEADGAVLAERLAAFQALRVPPWPMAVPRDGLDGPVLAPPPPAAHTVIAADGSQIAPSHHEIALCCLVNVGRILYTYGTGERPVQDSRPTLFHTDDELRPLIGGRRHAMSDELLGTIRGIQELEALVELAELALERGHPVVALVDGTLVPFMLDGKGVEFQDEVAERQVAVYDRLRELGVPVAGYVSNGRASEVGNMLRLVACPKPTLVCATCAKADPPCEGHLPLPDRRIWEARLGPGERSPLFTSQAPVLARYREHGTVFFYLHVGPEIARIEVPAWVADEPTWLDRVHAVALDQAEKGLGYPVALAEAHHRAVVSGEDRARFFALVGQRLARQGLPVQVSPKQLKKRMGVV
jgi:hypothetical protein